MTSAKVLIDTVVEGGYCVGCGACASLGTLPIDIKWKDGRYFPILKDGLEDRDVVCPFSSAPVNEDEIGKELYAQHAQYHPLIGYFISTFAGHASGDARARGSSGGMGSWIAETLLTEELIDGVIHIHARVPDKKDNRLFSYRISRTLEEIRQGAKSRYYPAELSEVLKKVRETPGRYLFVGLPCFVKSVRLLQRQDDVLRERIIYTMALFCGHLKSAGFAESLAWEIGVPPDELATVDFRVKLLDQPANRYGFSATSLKTGQTVVKPMRELTSADWGVGLFRLGACEFCDDVVGETADIAIGDAWLPQYVTETKGTNVVIVRRKELFDIVSGAMTNQQLSLEEISADMVAKSQSAGLRYRREGLMYRLWLKKKAGSWYPNKRVSPCAHHLGRKRKHILKLRQGLAQRSHELFLSAKTQGDLRVFLDGITPELHHYARINRQSIILKLLKKFYYILKAAK